MKYEPLLPVIRYNHDVMMVMMVVVMMKYIYNDNHDNNDSSDDDASDNDSDTLYTSLTWAYSSASSLASSQIHRLT